MPKNFFLAPALVTLRAQINALYPFRDKESDGWVGDTSHSARKSDHNPNSWGAVCAIDIDEDLQPGLDAVNLVANFVAKRDKRIGYLIYEGRMIRSYRAKNGTAPWVWTPYTGVNKHKHHVHVSVSQDRSLWNDGSAWDLTGLGSGATPTPATVTYRKGDSGPAVKEIQKRLILYAFLGPDQVDGKFGPKTETGLKAFQRANGLPDTGIVDQATRDKLF